MEGRQAWPLHMMGMGMGMAAASSTTTTGCFDDYYSSSSSTSSSAGGGGGDCGFLLGWEQLVAPAPFGCFGLLAADVHDLFPLCTYACVLSGFFVALAVADLSLPGIILVI